MNAIRRWLLIFIGCAAALTCRFAPEIAAFWQRIVVLPFARTASRLSSAVPFPVAEALALCGAGLLAQRLIAATWRCVRQWRWQPLAHWTRALCRGVAALLCVYLTVWMPAYWCESPAEWSASAEEVEALCRALIEELNASPLRFSGGDAALQIAVRAASAYAGRSLPDGSVKQARYPEWMDRLHLAGLYVPWTGEALVHPSLAPAAMPFTACHELMHRLGIADEGRANIAAWTACAHAGGEAADSANLWALRYAMTALREVDGAAWLTCAQRMSPGLSRIFSGMNGFASPAPRAHAAANDVLALAGLMPSVANYDALVGWLAHRLPSLSPATNWWTGEQALAAARSGQALKVHRTFIHSLPHASRAPATTKRIASNL